MNMCPGIGSECGDHLVDHEGVEKIAFTGSVATGQRILSRSAGNLKKVTLELGGKSPIIIMDDCDFEKAVATACNNSFANSGQGCFAPTRIYV